MRTFCIVVVSVHTLKIVKHLSFILKLRGHSKPVRRILLIFKFSFQRDKSDRSDGEHLELLYNDDEPEELKDIKTEVFIYE